MTEAVRAGRGPGVFLAVLAVAAVPIIVLAGGDQWFNYDEWAFLTDDGMPGFGAAFAEHNGHWVTVPRFVYYGLFSVFGLQTYLPYQLLAIATHLAAVGLSYLVTRRLGVGAWVAAAVAATLLLLGSGATNLVFAFQVSLNGSVALGLTQLLLADHDGPNDWRDFWGLGAALVGLMTSAVMVPLILGVGVATLIRRGWRAAAFHAGIPLGVFVVWYVLSVSESSRASGTLSDTVRLFVEMSLAPFEAMGQFLPVAVVLFGLLLFAVVDLARDFLSTRDRTPLGVPAALLVAWLGFCAVTAMNRSGFLSLDPDLAASARYVHIGAILLSPLVALGGWRLRRFHPALVWLPVAALLIGVPGNLQDLADYDSFWQEDETTTIAIAHSELIDGVPAESRPWGATNPDYADWGFDAGWLRRMAAASELPGPDSLTRSEQLTGDLFVAMGSAPDLLEDAPCEPVAGPLAWTAEPGDVLVYEGGIVLHSSDGDTLSSPLIIGNDGVSSREVLAGPIDLRVGGWRGNDPVVCVV